MRKKTTQFTEHELAVWFEVAPVFIINWIEESMMEAGRDELGYTITNRAAAQFEETHEAKLDAAVRLTATTKKFGVARATVRRAERHQRTADGDGDAS